MIKISCIIPAYNEASRIENVLRAVSIHPSIDEIIVVDDGSDDATNTIVARFNNVHLIVHRKNYGKSRAIYSGIKAAKGEFILMLDADLVGVTFQNIADLLAPVLTERADMSISLRRNSPLLWRLIGLDYLSGERVFPKKMLATHLKEIMMLSGFGFEVFLNKLAILNHYKINVVVWHNVKNTYKRKKYGFAEGLRGEMHMMGDIFHTISPLILLYQIIQLMKLKVKNNIIGDIGYKLSFVIPAYNEEAYIGDCLTSILRERARKNYDIEIIVVNNASTDATAAVAHSFPGVRVVDEPHKGLVYARRAGFLASTGDLIANVDADTILPSGWIAKVMEEFGDTPNLVALSGPFIYYDLSHAKNILIRNYYYMGFFAYLVHRYIMRVGSLLQGGNFVVRRWALEKIGGYNLAIDFYGEDTDLARRLHYVGPVKFTFKLPMYASGRRLVAEGLFTMGIRYPLNYFWTIFFKKPFTKEYIDIRSSLSHKKL